MTGQRKKTDECMANSQETEERLTLIYKTGTARTTKKQDYYVCGHLAKRKNSCYSLHFAIYFVLSIPTNSKMSALLSKSFHREAGGLEG